MSQNNQAIAIYFYRKTVCQTSRVRALNVISFKLFSLHQISNQGEGKSVAQQGPSMSVASQVSKKNGMEAQKSLPVEVIPYFFRQKVGPI